MVNPLQVFGTLPDASLFGFPPTNVPAPIPPIAVPTSIMRPFNIPDHIFVAALDYTVPLTIATVYAVTIKSLNVYNKAHNKKPWAISKTRPFFAFVVLHNIFLAVYSAWTFWGMLSGMRRSILNPMGPDGLVGTVDSFCRLHGGSGPGNSIYYNEASTSFLSAATNAPIVDGIPSRTEMGRMWNEGLAYYGWIFYLSKFYEVLDTFIILAKGKLSSTLQTYHHAGAMLSMWAGMRYMSAPIWMFVLVNSFIHSLMYFYYTLTAFSIRVPTPIKRTLTSMQITQFLVGASYAMAHSFVSYSAPVAVFHTKSTTGDEPAAPSDPIIPTVAANAIESLKSYIFGDAGVPTPGAEPDTDALRVELLSYTKIEHTTQPCITTTGETFAIWLNVVYLAPLTYLFVSFFIASYVKRSNAATKISGKKAAPSVNDNVALAEKAGWDAAKGIEKEVYGGESMVSGSSDETPATPTSKKANNKARRRA
ncbi:GNS1/SUR4 family-domain-containing protein [Dactylonectria estremocensis]|uniref:Elongation of fatty acids protein n=1 Tax=Dactylonectria estremocensis TaxID=1079267 RepID=A0A9P9FJL2_9HYPO|nr:GNS1/SUR4 family-domain-containing protein [Dactylonectria estremocensis]